MARAKNKRERICGIYAWEAICQSSSKFGGKYVGKSNHILERKEEHIRELKRNNHDNPRFKAYFNKYGILRKPKSNRKK